MKAKSGFSSEVWNPWHGCVKYSEGCLNCYVYRRDGSVGRDASKVEKTTAFDLPVRRYRNGEYKVPPGSTLFACMTSDFFLDRADAWRGEIWNMIRERRDINFFIITKRILRFYECAPPDWGDKGYPNVFLCCTIENQRQCDIRLPFFMGVPAAKKFLIFEPLLSNIAMGEYLTDDIEQVIAGGESGNEARVCDFDWVLNIRRQCIDKGVPFRFKQTGARLKKDGKIYRIERKFQHAQAKKANIDILA